MRARDDAGWRQVERSDSRERVSDGAGLGAYRTALASIT